MVDPADAPAQNSAMIALLPVMSNWCKQDLPHLTLVYAGEISKLKPTDFNDMAKDACSLAMITNAITLRVTSVEIFGDSDKVDVLKFQPSSEILAMRRIVEGWNASDFPFSPHATIGPVGSSVQLQQTGDIPTFVGFNRLYVGWGDESLTFWLKGGMY